jgi:hypothetical protein
MLVGHSSEICEYLPRTAGRRDVERRLLAQMSHIDLGSEMTEVTEAYGFRGRTMIDRDSDVRP